MNTFLNTANTVANGFWWAANALWISSEVVELKTRIEDTVDNPYANRKDYVIIAGKVITLTLDIAALGEDWDASGLSGKDLKISQTTSAQIQAAACLTSMGTNYLANGTPLDPEVMARILALARRTGQASDICALTFTATTIQASVPLAFLLQSCFEHWYETHGADADDVVFDDDYDGIPEAHHSNPIFSALICPITQEPIRFPVTAPNSLGGPDHHFERKAILKWLSRKNTNPVTNLPLHVDELKENDQMRQVIEDEMVKLGLPIG